MRTYEYKTIQRKVITEEGEREVVIIISKDKYTGNWSPSPITSFIVRKYKNRSKNTKYIIASSICNYLNYILDRIDNEDELFLDLRNQGIYGLNYKHGADYLSYLGREKTNYKGERILHTTVKYKENILKEFYRFLYENELINPEFKLEYLEIVNKPNRKRQKQVISPFDDERLEFDKVEYYYTERLSEKIKDMPEYLWIEFLMHAIRNKEDITLGIYFQIVGGLRKGEVVNLTLDSIEYAMNRRAYLKVIDRQSELFGEINTTTDCQVKRERKQPLLKSEKLFSIIYEQHMKLRNSRLSKNKYSHDNNAMFINDEGNPMTGKVYANRFNSLKESFIEKLKNIENEDGIFIRELDLAYLEGSDWSTHICRGIYTNLLIKMGLTKEQIRVLRGDKSEKSLNNYIDDKVIDRVLDTSIDNLVHMESYLNRI